MIFYDIGLLKTQNEHNDRKLLVYYISLKKKKKWKKNKEKLRGQCRKNDFWSAAAFNKNAIRAHATGHPRCIIYDFMTCLL